MVFDTAIVGTGPAAISAALTLKLHKKNIVWFGSRKLSPKVEKSEMIANYPGAAMVTGPELNRLYQEQIARAGLEITERQVTNILANRRGFMLQAGDEIFDAKPSCWQPVPSVLRDSPVKRSCWGTVSAIAPPATVSCTPVRPLPYIAAHGNLNMRSFTWRKLPPRCTCSRLIPIVRSSGKTLR